MAYFSGTLADILADLGWRQLDLAEKCGLPASQVSRYIAGNYKSLPLESVKRIVAALPTDQHARLLVAYLRDCLPAEYADLVRVESASGECSVREVPPLLSGIDREVDAMLRTYAELAMRHPEVRTMLNSFLDIIGRRE